MFPRIDLIVSNKKVGIVLFILNKAEDWYQLVSVVVIVSDNLPKLRAIVLLKK